MSEPPAGETTPLGLTQIAALLLTVEDTRAALRHLARMAVIVVPDGPTCGITMPRNGGYTTVVHAGRIPITAEEAQHEYGSGPALEALHSGTPVISQDLATETRWDGYPAAARAVGVQAIYAHPLRHREEVIGAISFYGHKANIFTEPVQRIAAQFTQPAAALLNGILHRHSQAELVTQLQTALTSRATIDQAVGILVARHHCPPGEAFHILRRMSQDRNTKLRDLAASIVHDAATSQTGPDHTNN
jgi:GAF domain-containing protein